ncbi:hypothetical protein QM012_005523 [Aureobasidium pullulans]|uniref:C2H2-type domain-containing protein n=1 Tax=Aureobasidium pullulans TaxID=5580 RepID=A0ABR0T4K1_AURPU
MANQNIQQIMADLRAREKRLSNNLAALEEESKAFARDQRELLLAIERDEGPTLPPQHPVAEALNTLHSTQIVEPPAMASEPGLQAFEGGVQPAEDDIQPAEEDVSLFVLEDAHVDESAVIPLSQPKRRVTFSDATATILSGKTPREDQDIEDIGGTEESFSFQPLPTDAETGTNQPVYTGERRPAKRARHSSRTSELMPCAGFTPITSKNDHIEATQDSLPVPVISDDINMVVDKPLYTGDTRPSRRVRYSSRSAILMLSTGFTPTLPDPKPATYPDDLVAAHASEDLFTNDGLSDIIGTYDPRLVADAPGEVVQTEQDNGMTAETVQAESQFVCPYPDCWKLYASSNDVEKHLEHDHPDWALIKYTVTDPNSI